MSHNIPKGKYGQLGGVVFFLTMPVAEKEALREFAKAHNLSMNEVTREAIKAYIAKMTAT